MVRLGPVTLTWHGIMSAAGIAVGAWLAAFWARREGLDRDSILNIVLLMAVAGVIGARVFYLTETGGIVRPEDWFGTRGFSFYGGLIFGSLAAAAVIWRERLSLRYLDALAAGFPLGMAVGRIGDVISGEHYGAATTVPWAIRYTHPDAEVPSPLLAYHPGALYEIIVSLVILAMVPMLWKRLRQPAALFFVVVGLYAAGRFTIFFFRSDSPNAVLGLSSGQVTSIALMAVALLGVWWSARAGLGRETPPTPGSKRRALGERTATPS